MKRSSVAGAFSTLKIIAGSLILIYCVVSSGRLIGDHWYLELVFVAAGITTNMPLNITRAGSRMDFGIETLFVVALALSLPTQIGTVAFCTGILIGLCFFPQLAKQEHHGITVQRLNNTASATIGIFIALSAAHLIGGIGINARSVAGAVTAGLIYDPVTLLLVALDVWLSRQIKFWQFVWTCLRSEYIWPFLVCCGVLLGALANSFPWTLLLAAAPMGLIFLASNAQVVAVEDRTRLDRLLTAATTILESATVTAVIEAATAAAGLLFAQASRIDTEPARQHEISAPLVTEQLGVLNFVLGRPAAGVQAPYSETDQRLLETLATITVSALDKAAQHESATLQSRLDALTGLANRRSFEEQVRTTLLGMRASDGAGIIFVDLDGFKKVNDVHGHKAGDEVLVQTAARLSGATRGGDVVARLGGDEFTILLRGVRIADDAILVAERVLEAMRQPIVLSSGAEVTTTPSVGIALALEPGADPVAVLQAADAAMYEAKRAGKDCWRLGNVAVDVVEAGSEAS